MRGELFIITGSSGVGKDTVIEGLQKSGLEFAWVVTTTTRAMRVGESEGHPYYFVSREKFEEMIKNNELFEYADVYGNYYGGTFKEVEQKLSENEIVFLKIDPTGVATVKSKLPEVFTIFIAPPSLETLKNRLINRGTDSPEAIEKRLAQVQKEMELAKDFDVTVINEEGRLEETADKVKKIIEGRLNAN
jgi:guanylate kinase